MAKQRPGFMIYEDMRRAIELLSDESAGIMLKACIAYVFDGKEPEFYGINDYIWQSTFKVKMDRDQAKYEKVSEIRKDAANSRWRSARLSDMDDANASKSMQMDASASFAMQNMPTTSTPTIAATSYSETTTITTTSSSAGTSGQQTDDSSTTEQRTTEPPAPKEIIRIPSEPKKSWDIRRPGETDEDFVQRRRHEMIAHMLGRGEDSGNVDKSGLHAV